jgi:hypothetical protein
MNLTKNCWFTLTLFSLIFSSNFLEAFNQKPFDLDAFDGKNLVLISLNGLRDQHLVNGFSSLNKYFVSDELKFKTNSLKSSHFEYLVNNFDKNKNKIALIGNQKYRDILFLNNNANVKFYYENELNWYERINILLDWLVHGSLDNQMIHFATVFFSESMQNKFNFSSSEAQNLFHEYDLIIDYLIKELIKFNLINKVNIIITSGKIYFSINKI